MEELKQEIIKVIEFDMRPEVAELKADRIIELFKRKYKKLLIKNK